MLFHLSTLFQLKNVLYKNKCFLGHWTFIWSTGAYFGDWALIVVAGLKGLAASLATKHQVAAFVRLDMVLIFSGSSSSEFNAV